MSHFNSTPKTTPKTSPEASTTPDMPALQSGWCFPQLKSNATTAGYGLVFAIFKTLNDAYLQGYSFNHTDEPQRLVVNIEQLVDLMQLFCGKKYGVATIMKALQGLDYPRLEGYDEVSLGLKKMFSTLWDQPMQVFSLYFENGNWWQNADFIPLTDLVDASQADTRLVIGYDKFNLPIFDVDGAIRKADMVRPLVKDEWFVVNPNADDADDADDAEKALQSSQPKQPQAYGYGSIEEIVDAADYYEEMSLIYEREKQALKCMVSELIRRLYDVAPESNVTFDITDLAQSSIFEYEAMVD